MCHSKRCERRIRRHASMVVPELGHAPIGEGRSPADEDEAGEPLDAGEQAQWPVEERRVAPERRRR
jgi:hypothetical protein